MLGHQRHSVTQLEEPCPRLRRKGSLALPSNTERTLLDFLNCEQSRTTISSIPSTTTIIRRTTTTADDHAVAAPIAATPPPVPARPPAVPKRAYVPPIATTTAKQQQQQQHQQQVKHNNVRQSHNIGMQAPKLPIKKSQPIIPPQIPPPEANHPPLRVPPRNQNSLDSSTLCRNNTVITSQTRNPIRSQQPVPEAGKNVHNKGQFSEKYVQRNNSQLPVASLPTGVGQVFDFTTTATTQHEFNVTSSASGRNKIPSAPGGTPPVATANAAAAAVKGYQNNKVVSGQSSNVPPPLTHMPNGQVNRSTSNSKISVRQDSSVSSDSFSQTSSPSYTTKTMETPLLPHHGVNSRSVCNGKLANKTNALVIKNQPNIENGRDINNTALTKSVSTPASLQTIVRFHNGSNMSLHHRIIRDMRRPSSHYVGHVRFRFRFAQVMVNLIALLAIGGGLAAYFKAYPTAVQVIGVNTTIAPVSLPAVTGTNPAPGICLPVIVNFCQQHKVPYNFTVFPNYMGHFTQRDAQQELEMYEAVVDVRCYELAALFLCSLSVPKCGAGGIVVRPCRSLCFETKRRCGFFLDVFGLALPDYLECGLFPESADPEECVGHHEVKEAKMRAQRPVCPSGFQCDVKRCIPKDWQCDGHVDCKDQSDELNCVQCSKGMIHCGDEKCMSQEHMCDGKVDCPWAQDERNCLRLSERNGDEGRGQLEVFRPEHQQWVPACVAHWDQESSPNETCSLLGYSSANGSRLNKGTDANIAPPIHEWRMHQTKRSKNLMREFGSCSGNSYPTVDLTCVDYMCGKTRKSYAELRTLRIVGGITSKPGDWPFLAALLGGPEEIFYCAGVLIADQWVLTASHCVGNHSDVSGWTIQLGITRRHAHSYYGQKMKVRRVVPHPLYNLGVAHDNDVALFQLSTRVTFHEHLLPVCLPSATKELHPGTVCTVIGWGKKEDKGMSEYEPAVNEVEVPVLNRDLCNQWLENRDLNVTEGMICAGYKEGGKDACQGDSGGPLLCRDDNDRDRWFVGGIVSWGIKCAHPHLPGVYAYVPKYIPWILQQISQYSD